MAELGANPAELLGGEIQGRRHGLSDQYIGLILAVSSSVFIGSSFIIKKKGLRIAGAQGLRAGAGGFGYLQEPVWWLGLLAMVFGELANFAAYAFAPAVIVTPLGALSIIVSAVLAHALLKERLNAFGMLGCALCIVGSLVIVLHAPEERPIHSITEVAALAAQAPFLTYALAAVSLVVYLAWVVAPEHGSTNLTVYVGICSLMGSLSVMSCKGLGIAIKLTIEGNNQFGHLETYCAVLVVAACVVTQMNYLNKALDIFSTALVSPVYYVMFTALTVLASMVLFRDPQTGRDVLSELCGFVTIVAGTFLLHATKDLDVAGTELVPLVRDGGRSPDPLDAGVLLPRRAK